jgi:hypothetical protein
MFQWYLSFDCATKTFAYILIKINYDHLFIDTTKLLKLVKQLKCNLHNDGYSEDIEKIINKINIKTKNVIEIITGDCIDLIPGIKNKDITTVERIKIVSNYTKNNIFPIIKDIPKDDLSILVEFQMSHNTQSKIVSIALLTLFSDYELCLVNPSLKNKLYFTEQGRYCYFIEKYKNTYDANKKHALFNFKEFERIFDQKINLSDKLKGHIADAFMQVLGYIMYPMNKSIN